MPRGKAQDVIRKEELAEKFKAKAKNTFFSLLQKFGSRRKLFPVKRVHKRLVKHGLLQDQLLSSLLIDAYGKCGEPDRARAVFDTLEEPNSHSWNFMIRIHALHNQQAESLSLFKLMQKQGVPQDKYTFSAALAACSSPAALPQGKCIHRTVLKHELEYDAVVATSLINMYGKCGSLRRANDVFDRMLDRNPIAWTTMVNAYTKHECHKEAFQLFHQMHMEGILATLITCVSVLGACSSLKNITSGKHIHLYITCNSFELNVKAWNAIINMYAKCGCLDVAYALLMEVPESNVITWTSIITAYSQHMRGKEALQLFHEMMKTEIVPNRVTLVSILDACASLTDLYIGQLMHTLIVDMESEDETVIGTALVNLYGKCGQLDDARMLFKRMKERNLHTWSTMIGVYTQHGHGKKALALFSRMRRTGLKPDKVTFVHVLSACSRSGLVEEGRHFFSMMQDEYGIEPTVDHYSCMTDLLGRAGCLDEAEAYIKKLPKELRIVPWRTMLGACKVQGDVDRGEGAAERLVELDPTDTAPYITLPSIYVGATREMY
ncbi:hypothetical protein GOP47_0005769 [Adiantum capillus-veneris]|uniref:Pentatricopeptide repeat-containing protein n=1 Tax=Adiantum capillus-veneris TaxID=13818 RepID=A0A9D4ZPF5_ADICA|nr:hypothetical protein GOP47_0005769 [Adiantum capillus-veneris]